MMIRIAFPKCVTTTAACKFLKTVKPPNMTWTEYKTTKIEQREKYMGCSDFCLKAAYVIPRSKNPFNIAHNL